MKTRAELAAAVRGYWVARALLTASEIGLFPALGRRRLSAPVLAKRIGADPRALGLLLDALTGQGVLVKERTAYRIAPAVRPFLTAGPDSALGMLAHHATLWHLWDGLSLAVTGGGRERAEPGFRGGPAAARAFTMAMRDGAVRFAAAVAEEIPLGGRRHLVDLGGGPGVYAVELARLHPGLTVDVMDLPDVAAVGEEVVAGYPDVRDRIRYHPGDIDLDPLPAGIDAALLSHVIHGKGEKGVRRLLARIADALPRRGLLVVRDFFLAPDRTTPAPASLFSLNMLVATPHGRCYSAEEIADRAREAGFATARFRRSRAVPDTGYLFARK
jgi:hypothetical protein